MTGLTTYTIQPLQDPRWDELVRVHPAASIFHTRGWLQALQRTYSYEPVAFTTSPPAAPLANAVVFCRIRSWLTGPRVVSLPFADHCAPLANAQEASGLIPALRQMVGDGWRSVEIRPPASGLVETAGWEESAAFRLHVLGLRPSLDDLYKRTHPSGIQRKLRRAEREGLHYEEGRSPALLQAFYRLMVTTRSRHGVPPPPSEWFRNLIDSVGAAATIRVARKDGRAIGSILTLQHRGVLTYKYGCSDATVHNLGAMPFLFWRAIVDAKALGLHSFDLGRSDLPNSGLIAFKERLGAVPSTLTYFRCGSTGSARSGEPSRMRKQLVARLPAPLLVMTGRLLYRHMG
jgi:hypothetical protein